MDTAGFAVIERVSFVAGETLKVRVNLPNCPFNLQDLTNVSVDVFRIDIARNQLAIGFGTAPQIDGDGFWVSCVLPNELLSGLHTIGSAVGTLRDSAELGSQVRIQFEPLVFEIRSPTLQARSADEIFFALKEVANARQAYATRQLVTASAQTPNGELHEFRVLILAEGCLLHSPQQLEGYSLVPLDWGFSPQRQIEILSDVLRRIGQPPIVLTDEVVKRFERSTPTFLIDYCNVLAVDHDDALDFCRDHAKLVFDLLGLDRGQKPSEFACYALQFGADQAKYAILHQGYTGNLVSDFNPVSTANSIETLLPKISTKPFLKLLARVCADATAETDPGFKVLRQWAVLELVAMHRIPGTKEPIFHLDGSPILDERNNPVVLDRSASRVYEYIRQNGTRGIAGEFEVDGHRKKFFIGNLPDYVDPEEPVIRYTLWDLVKATYAVRNMVAHQGYFDLAGASEGKRYERIAAELVQLGQSVSPFDFARRNAELAAQKELYSG